VQEPLDTGPLRDAFDRPDPLTVGLEEEVILVDPATMLPIPAAADAVVAAADPRIKQELPACQVEIFTRPHEGVAGALAELASARAALARACGDWARPAAAAVHPLAASADVVSTERGQAFDETYGEVARRQLVGALQVHVAVGGAEATLPVYNALRGHLPELAALAAAAPFHEGHDTGLASIRPVIAGQLPRQGVPPAITSWASFADDLRWGAMSGSVPEPRRWWWELRPHVQHGTLEVRVPDVQPTVTAARGIASVVHALVCRLVALHHDGCPLPTHPTWRIAENRWSALRDGVHGTLADLRTGEPQPTDRRLHALLDEIEPHAPCGLDAARCLIDHNAADDLRAVGVDGAMRWLTDRFTAG
jgi:carboxylate-amine ligase